MKYTFSEMQEYYAHRRGFSTFSQMKAGDQTAAKILINSILDEIWYAKQWGFCGARYQLSLVPPVTGTVTGTAGEYEITLGAAITESYNGVKVRGQYILIDARLYKIAHFRSTTVLSLDAPLQSTVSGAAYTLYFLDYPLPPGIGMIRSIRASSEDVGHVNEFASEIDNTEGDTDFGMLAGVTDEAFLASGTVSVTQNSDAFVYSGTVSQEHVGKPLLLKKSNAYQLFKVIDIDTTGGAGTNTFIVDRPYKDATEASLSFELQPRGTMLIKFKPYETTRELIEIKYTFAPIKLVADADTTLLPSDTPMMRGIEVAATKWETVGEGNINEVLFADKKFTQSLKVLNLRGGMAQLRMLSMQEITRLRRWPRNTNPWNQGPWR